MHTHVQEKYNKRMRMVNTKFWVMVTLLIGQGGNYNEGETRRALELC